MSHTGTAPAIQVNDQSETTRRPALRVVREDRGWDDVPDGPVPANVIRYFEAALEREATRRRAREMHDAASERLASGQHG